MIPEATTITVKEAALALGKSKSTVYRMNREGSPFPFSRVGHRIYIDADQFHMYLARVRTDAPEHATATELQSATHATTTPVRDEVTSRSWSGQRELVIFLPRRENVVLFVY